MMGLFVSMGAGQDQQRMAWHVIGEGTREASRGGRDWLRLLRIGPSVGGIYLIDMVGSWPFRRALCSSNRPSPLFATRQ